MLSATIDAGAVKNVSVPFADGRMSSQTAAVSSETARKRKRWTQRVGVGDQESKGGVLVAVRASIYLSLKSRTNSGKRLRIQHVVFMLYSFCILRSEE